MTLDRQSDLRIKPAAIEALKNDPNARVVPLGAGRCLVRAENGKAVAAARVPAKAATWASGEWTFLGTDDVGPLFAIDLGAVEKGQLPTLEGCTWQSLLRAGLTLPRSDFLLLSYVKSLLEWQNESAYSAATGETCALVDAGHVRESSHGQRTFPRVNPAVMILVTHGDECLLARQPGFPTGMYSALAGFVEHGESAEDTVIRETHEEVGLEVESPEYFGSAPWPFPASLMLAFRVEAKDKAFKLDPDELEDATWVSRQALRDGSSPIWTPPPMSLAHQLIQDFANS